MLNNQRVVPADFPEITFLGHRSSNFPDDITIKKRPAQLFGRSPLALWLLPACVQLPARPRMSCENYVWKWYWKILYRFKDVHKCIYIYMCVCVIQDEKWHVGSNQLDIASNLNQEHETRRKITKQRSGWQSWQLCRSNWARAVTSPELHTARASLAAWIPQVPRSVAGRTGSRENLQKKIVFQRQ